MKTLRITFAVSIASLFIISSCKDDPETPSDTNCYICTESNGGLYPDEKRVCDPDVNQKISDLTSSGYTCIKE